jgi:hypothetical protein
VQWVSGQDRIPQVFPFDWVYVFGTLIAQEAFPSFETGRKEMIERS